MSRCTGCCLLGVQFLNRETKLTVLHRYTQIEYQGVGGGGGIIGINSHVQDTTVLEPEVFLTAVCRGLLVTHM